MLLRRLRIASLRSPLARTATAVVRARWMSTETTTTPPPAPPPVAAHLATCQKDGARCECFTYRTTSVGPIEVKMTEKPQFICRCGQSAKFPYCDGAHNAINKAHGTNYKSFKMDATTHKAKVGASVWICGCGHAKTRPSTGGVDRVPTCDGSHNKLVAFKPKL